MKKAATRLPWLFRGFVGDGMTKLPNDMGILIKHYKDPVINQPVGSIKQRDANPIRASWDFFVRSHSETTNHSEGRSKGWVFHIEDLSRILQVGNLVQDDEPLMKHGHMKNYYIYMPYYCNM